MLQNILRKNVKMKKNIFSIRILHSGFVAQGLEHWSCKPGLESSNLSGGFFVIVSKNVNLAPGIIADNSGVICRKSDNTDIASTQGTLSYMVQYDNTTSLFFPQQHAPPKLRG